MTRQVGFSILFVLVAASCNGKTGPTGPAGTTGANGSAGATGAAGPAGPGTHFVVSAPVPDGGSVTIPLPAAAGTLANPPVITCYVSTSGTLITGYFVIAGALKGAEPYCSIGQSGPTLSVFFANVPGRTALVSGVY